MIVHLVSSFDATIDFQRTTESLSRFTRRSSASFSSKQEIGARNRSALTSSKYGSHAARCGEQQMSCAVPFWQMGSYDCAPSF